MCYHIINSIRYWRIFFMGLTECRGDVGMTWADSLDKCEAYDAGRTIGRAVLMLD